MRHFIPIVNRVVELLPRALGGCEALWHCTTIIDNRDTHEEMAIDLGKLASNVNVYRPPVPLTTAQSMNLMLAKAKQSGLGFFTWQHLDAVPLGDTARQIPELARALFERGERWGVLFTNYDAFAAYNVAALNETGGWDWKRFPYYFLDDDLHRRIRAAGYDLIDSGLPCYHEGSTTIIEPERAAVSHAFFKASETLYQSKHGCLPGAKTQTRWWKDL